jgi:hypothetical protein
VVFPINGKLTTRFSLNVGTNNISMVADHVRHLFDERRI